MRPGLHSAGLLRYSFFLGDFVEPTLPPDPGPASETPPAPAAPISPAVAVAVPPLPNVPAYRDRGTGLMIFGVVQIILGLLAALMVPIIALSAFVSRLAPGRAMRPGQFVH